MAWLRSAATIGLLAVILAITFNNPLTAKPDPLPPLVHGKNLDTILFFSLAESGQINAQLATTQALLEHDPNLKIHFASFPWMHEKVARVSSFARKRNPSTPEIAFHDIPGPDRMQMMLRQMNCTSPLDCLAHSPGAKGGPLLGLQLELALWPWYGEDHWAIYQSCQKIIEEVDAAVIVVDFAFRPSMDAVLNSSRVHAILSPLAMADLFAIEQPWLSGFWKYPAWGTGFPFPVPWHLVLENIWVNFRVFYHVIAHPVTKDTIKYLDAKGINNNAMQTIRSGLPFITQTIPEASLPLEIVPEGVLAAGAIVLESAPAHEQDPELAKWIEKAPTMIVNLGSLFKYTEERAKIMAEAIRAVLDNHNIQVLWKVAKGVEFDDQYTAPLKEYLERDQARIMKWLPIDTLPLLQLKNVTISVHHGGSSSFNEAIVSGQPQVVIPIWEDHYNFAQLAESLGVGFYGTRGTAPDWTVDGIAKPILRILAESEESAKIRAEAKRISERTGTTSGRHTAAKVILDLVKKQADPNTLST